ncbi:hypothetical protein CALCODRAFT_85437 [Calocera cornea HHB12733]|uniref:Uncharacterized protein n=1 Tax=Calocera cornea HHB12733 TaxID=1353952 RepID=A0A165INZ7_9BASI|nr:hypothetical protein CALCODRAFT_85437 [Calocera cornea HHB12733]
MIVTVHLPSAICLPAMGSISAHGHVHRRSLGPAGGWQRDPDSRFPLVACCWSLPARASLSRFPFFCPRRGDLATSRRACRARSSGCSRISPSRRLPLAAATGHPTRRETLPSSTCRPLGCCRPEGSSLWCPFLSECSIEWHASRLRGAHWRISERETTLHFFLPIPRSRTISRPSWLQCPPAGVRRSLLRCVRRNPAHSSPRGLRLRPAYRANAATGIQASVCAPCLETGWHWPSYGELQILEPQRGQRGIFAVFASPEPLARLNCFFSPPSFPRENPSNRR